jgi:pyocin large subunit-like protein
MIPRMRRLVISFARTLAAAALALVAGCGPGAAPHATATAAPAGAASVARAPAAAAPAFTHRDAGFRSRRLLEEHYEKHGSEFGDVTRAQYLRLAQDLRDRPAGGDVLEIVRDDGTISRFDRATGTFVAFDDDGTLHTCFRPRDGERYFRRQALRSHGR